VSCAANGHFVTGFTGPLSIRCGMAQGLFHRLQDPVEDRNAYSPPDDHLLRGCVGAVRARNIRPHKTQEARL
jgi:hypothetical protein